MFLRILILGIILYAVYVIPDKFLKLDYFNLTKINFSGETKMLESELTSLSKKIYNRNSIDIDWKALENFLKKDVRLENVIVEKKAIDEVDIYIKEKDVYCYAMIKDKIYLVDSNGSIFGYFNEKKRDALPIVVVYSKKDIKDCVELILKIEASEFFKLVSQVYKLNENEFKIVLEDGVEIKTNLKVDSEKYKILEILYNEMTKNNKIEYMDLRFDDYIIKYTGDEKNEGE